MSLEIFKPLKISGIKPNISAATNRNVFFTSQPADIVELKSLDRFTSEQAIKKMIAKNPKIAQIIQGFNPETRLNMKELQELLKAHAKDTQNIANEITDNLPQALQNKVNRQILSDACYLHDLGKVLIPKNILNKPAKLTADEFKIMDTHSELSYELLKTTGINPKTLKLIKNHHQKPNILNKIIPINNNNRDITLEILSTADKYSALTEKRIYKDALTPQQALAIIYKDVKNGNLSEQVFLALANTKTATPITKAAV